MKTVVLFSGGLDSTALLALLKDQRRDLVAISFDYGQRHRRELDAARAVVERLGISHRILDIRSLTSVMQGSALTSENVAVPHGHYEEQSMQATVVPNRNMIFLSLAFAEAIQVGADRVAYGAHAGDHAIYPDCRPEFVRAMGEAARLCHYRPIELETPFVEIRKEEIVHLGAEVGAPFELTWSCYEGGERHCGRCGTCVERREAFSLAGISDPTDYAT